MKPLRWFGALALALATGCASAQSTRWNREDLRPTAVHGDRQLDHVRFWSGDSVFVWHWVVVTPDSIRGYSDAHSGQVYFRALPLSVVDSLEVAYPEDAQRRAGTGGDFKSDLGIIGLILLALLTP